jgi:hypothetical protein
MKTERVHELTVAEIGRLVGEFNRRRREVTERQAARFSAAEAGYHRYFLQSRAAGGKHDAAARRDAYAIARLDRSGFARRPGGAG